MRIIDLDIAEGSFSHSDFQMGKSFSCMKPIIPNFINELSKKILHSKQAKNFPDLVTFGYFCRRANIERLRADIVGLKYRLGWGTTLHIAPSNIPINFAFSFLMGFLSGNSNIVRLPTKEFAQTKILIEIIGSVLKMNDYNELQKHILFIKTGRDSKLLEDLVKHVDCLLVWGGDQAVGFFRGLAKKPNCVDIYFPDRVSSSLISARAILNAGENEMSKVAKKFFNDSFLVDNNACSSPSIIFWLGERSDIERAKLLFWNCVKLVTVDYNLDPVARIDKHLNILDFCNTKKARVKIQMHSEDIWTCDLDNFASVAGGFGNFQEVAIESISDISTYLRQNEQTLTYYGVDPEAVFKEIKSFDIRVDRVVPLGRALDLGMHWDGKSVCEILSRKVEVLA